MTPSTHQNALSLDRFKFVVPQDVYSETKEGNRTNVGERHSEKGEPAKRDKTHVHEVRLAMKGEYPG